MSDPTGPDTAPEPASGSNAEPSGAPPAPSPPGCLLVGLIALTAVAALLANLAGALLVFATDVCSVRSCDGAQLDVAGHVVTVGPWVVFALVLLGVGICVSRHTSAVWVPLVGLGLILALYVTAQVMVTGAVPGA